MDHVVGVVPLKEFLATYHAAGDTNVLRLIAREVVFLPDNLTLDRLLEALVERRTRFAVLVDELGGTQGIVTLRDIIDELIAPSKSISTHL
jgi:CBS domain containing-hemolysin-like protein